MNLCTWLALPGWATTAEVLLRGRHHATTAAEVVNAACVAADSEMLLLLSGNISLLSGRVSLAATVQKLFWPFLQRGHPKLCRSDMQAREGDQQPLQHTASERIDIGKSTSLVHSMIDTVSKLDDLLTNSSTRSAASSSNHSASDMTQMGSKTTCAKQECRANQQAEGTMLIFFAREQPCIRC